MKTITFTQKELLSTLRSHLKLACHCRNAKRWQTAIRLYHEAMVYYTILLCGFYDHKEKNFPQDIRDMLDILEYNTVFLYDGALPVEVY